MKKGSILCTLLCLFMSVSLFAQENGKEKATADLQKMIGVWTFTAPNPMGGDEMQGTCTFSVEEGKVVALMQSESSEDIKITDLTPNDDGASYGSGESQGYTLTISFKFNEKEELEGLIDAGVVQIPMTMAKEKK